MIVVPASKDGVPFEPIPEGRPTVFMGFNQMLYVFDDYDQYTNFLKSPVINPENNTDSNDVPSDSV